MNTALIIDDSRLARLTLKRLIVKHDIEVSEADGVDEAWLWLEHNPNPDVIFLDIMMPNIDGYEGLSLLKRNEHTKNIPVIMYSGDVSEESRMRAKEGGANGFLPKPADNTRVDHLIAALSKRKQSQTPQQSSASSSQSVEAKQSSTQQFKPNLMELDSAESDELLRSQLKHLTFRVEQLEKKNAELSEETQQSHTDQAQRDITFLQRQLTTTVSKNKLSLVIAGVALLLALIALIMVFIF